jgi:hypothetical protein
LHASGGLCPVLFDANVLSPLQKEVSFASLFSSSFCQTNLAQHSSYCFGPLQTPSVQGLT